MNVTRVGEFTLGWGESVVWDDRAARLYFVDCAARTVHWLDSGEGDLHTLTLPSMATGMVPTENGLLVGALKKASTSSTPTPGRPGCSAPIRTVWEGVRTTRAPTSPAISSRAR